MKMNILKHNLIYRNPIRNIPQLFRNIKYAYQRITRGYSDADVWSLDYFISELLYGALNQLADEGYTWNNEKFNTPEEWKAYLKDMANHFNNCLIDNSEKSDETYDKLCKYRQEKIAQGINTTLSDDIEKDPYLTELINDWLESEKEVSLKREQEKNLACDMLKEIFFSLWD